MGLDLLNDALVIGEHGEQLQPHILGLGVEREGEGDGLLLAGLDLQVVLDDGEVAQDGLVLGGAVGQDGGGVQGAADKGELDGGGLAVGDLDEGLGRAAIDELDAEDVGVGEAGGHVGGEVLGGVDGRRRAGGVILVHERQCQHFHVFPRRLRVGESPWRQKPHRPHTRACARARAQRSNDDRA